MNLIKKIKQYFKPVYTLEYCEPDKTNQTQEIKSFKNGKYTKSVVIRYITEEQYKRITGNQ